MADRPCNVARNLKIYSEKFAFVKKSFLHLYSFLLFLPFFDVLPPLVPLSYCSDFGDIIIVIMLNYGRYPNIN